MRWKHRVNFRKYLGDGEGKEDMLRAAGGVREELEKLPCADQVLKSLLVELDQAAELGKLNWFNSSLDRIYDWCDENSVWVETMTFET